MMRALAVAFALAVAPAAWAQSAQTWVSGVGDDANPCSRTAPCATFAGALAHTMPGGEIVALDPGDYGPVTINQALTIDGGRNPGGILGGGSSGIVVSAGPTDAVVLRRLAVTGGQGMQTGISFVSGAALTVADCAIAGFHDGLVFEPAAGGQLLVQRTVVRDNANVGVRVGAGGAAPSFALIASTHADHNGDGFVAEAGARMTLYDCGASGNLAVGIAATSGPLGGAAEVNVEGGVVDGNGVGVQSTAMTGSAVVRLSNVSLDGNTSGPAALVGNGAVLGFGNNHLGTGALPGLKLGATATAMTVTAGASATWALMVTVAGTLGAPIALACTGLPAGAACSFSPASLPATGGAVTLTVSTAAATPGPGMMGALDARSLPWPPLLLALALLALAAATRTRSARRLLLGLALAIPACKNTQPPPTTTPTTTTFQVTATSGSLVARLPLQITIQ